MNWRISHEKVKFFTELFVFNKMPFFDEIEINIYSLLQLIDTNKDGVVTIDELVEWCSRDEQILQSLETLDTVL